VAENSSIAWTDHTFNPWMGCAKVSQGCKHCYAETLITNRMGRDLFGATEKRSRTSKSIWEKPVAWNRAAAIDRRPRKVFVASLADVFEDAPGPNEWRPDVWALIRACPWLDFQLLTKRPENINRMLPDGWGRGWPNVWLGTSIEDRHVVERANILAGTPAFSRFISYEPAIGPVFYDFPEPGGRASGMPGNFDWTEDGCTDPELDLTGIDWLIAGGESGSDRRPMNLGWAHDARFACQEAGVAFFFKQISAYKPGQGEDALGRVFHQFPISWDRANVDTHPVFAPEGSLL
jgi:protein gp37